MELLIPGNYYMELPKVNDLINLDVSILKYNIEKGLLEITICLDAKYYKSDYEIENNVKQNKTLTLLIDNSINVDDINISNIKTEVVFNQGVEVIFDINVKYVDELTNHVEVLKDEIDEEKDILLESILSNVRNSEEVEEEQDNVEIDSYADDIDTDLITLEDSYTTIKIIRIENEKDLEAISIKYQMNIRDIYEQNNFNITDKVILRINE